MNVYGRRLKGHENLGIWSVTWLSVDDGGRR